MVISHHELFFFKPIHESHKATGCQGPKDQQITVESTSSLEIFNMFIKSEVSSENARGIRQIAATDEKIVPLDEAKTPYLDIKSEVSSENARGIRQIEFTDEKIVPLDEAKTPYLDKEKIIPDLPRPPMKVRKKVKSQSKKKEPSEVLREPPYRYSTTPELMVIYSTVPLLKFEMNPFVIRAGKIGRKYPERIVPWDSFESSQQETWDILSTLPIYSDRHFWPSAHLHGKIMDDLGTNYIENVNFIVLRPVLDVLKQFFSTQDSRQRLLFPGHAKSIAFMRDLKNLHDSKVTKADPEMQKAFEDHDVCDHCTVYNEKENGIPIYRIDYMSPLTLSAGEILHELQGESISTRDLAKNKGNHFIFRSKRQVLAVITHLFSSMIETGLQYGYVWTTEAIIFLHISDDPSQVEYYVCNSRFNFKEPESLHTTPIAKIVAFSIQAVAAKPPPQEWHDAAAKLDTWAVDYNDIVQNNPERSRGEQIMHNRPNYKTSQAATLISQLPVAWQSEHQTEGTGSKDMKREKDPAKCLNSDVPKDKLRSHDPIKIEEVEDFGKSMKSDTRPLNNAKKSSGSRKRVHERDYCSTACLLGLANGGDLDPNCPNHADHGQSHLERYEFLYLLQQQLERDRGRITDCEPLWISGNLGAVMFKITLTSHGYTVIAKGMEDHKAHNLVHEEKIYLHLQSIQGVHIPVCLGFFDLLLPYYHWSCKYECLLLQSYAGVHVKDTIDDSNKYDILNKAVDAIEAIHHLGVLHTHLHTRNILTNNTESSSKYDYVVHIIDFAHAAIVREEKEEIGETRKRKREQSLVTRAFAKEMLELRSKLRSCYFGKRPRWLEIGRIAAYYRSRA